MPSQPAGAFPRRGDVFWFDFGTPRGSEQGGHRPAVIVSNDVANQYSPVVTVAAITSATQKRPYPQNVSLPQGSPLPKPSTILCGQLLTTSKERLEDQIGSLAPSQLVELDEALHEALGLALH